MEAGNFQKGFRGRNRRVEGLSLFERNEVVVFRVDDERGGGNLGSVVDRTEMEPVQKADGQVRVLVFGHVVHRSERRLHHQSGDLPRSRDPYGGGSSERSSPDDDPIGGNSSGNETVVRGQRVGIEVGLFFDMAGTHPVSAVIYGVKIRACGLYGGEFAVRPFEIPAVPMEIQNRERGFRIFSEGGERLSVGIVKRF